MAITVPVYCTREDVMGALDIKGTFINRPQVDRAVMAATGDVHGILKRRFYPEDGTKYWDWPNFQSAYPWRIWFDQYDLCSASSVAVAGDPLDLGDVFFEPVNKEPGEPYEYLELNRGSSASFGGGPTPQRNIAITGTWGYSDTTAPAGSLAVAITEGTATQATISDSSLIGTGQIIVIDAERMIVSDRAMTSTGNLLGGDLAAQNNDVTALVAGGTGCQVGETILVDSERMLITDIAGDGLTVKRAWDGSVLAAHTSGATVYAPRLLTVMRGVLGTAVATHTETSAVSKYVFPGLVAELAEALAMNTVLQQTSGYARTVGAGDNLRNASGAGLADLRARAVARYGRKARSRVI